MSALKLPNRTMPRTKWSPNKHGYIGIDFGTRAVKIAQIKRQGTGENLLAKWSIPVEIDGDLGHSDYIEQTLHYIASEIGSLRTMFHGCDVAISLPDALAPLRLVEVPCGTASDVRKLLYEELINDLGSSEFCFDYWKTRPDSSAPTPGVQVAAQAVSHDSATRYVKMLSSVCWTTQILDSHACAISRSMSHTTSSNTREALKQQSNFSEGFHLALDIGFHSARMIICHKNVPYFCRLLNGCGLESFLRPLCESLNLSDRQGESLLREVGISKTSCDSWLGPLTSIVKPLQDPMDHLVAELESTLSYIDRQFHEQNPRNATLFGGGAMIRHLPETLSNRLGLPVNRWSYGSPNEQDPEDDMALFGGAIALSRLALGDHPCI